MTYLNSCIYTDELVPPHPSRSSVTLFSCEYVISRVIFHLGGQCRWTVCSLNVESNLKPQRSEVKYLLDARYPCSNVKWQKN